MDIAQLVMMGMTIGEAKVAQPVLEGKSNNEIAAQLFISEKTVKFHLTKIFRKFECKSRSQFIVKFLNQRPVVVSEESSDTLVHGSLRYKIPQQ